MNYIVLNGSLFHIAQTWKVYGQCS